MLPCLLFEDDDLLVVNKPAGLNTHAPSPYAGEGLYDWLRHREPRWAKLAIIHRLDKETSGVIVFSKTKASNRSLTEQFTRRTVRKSYILLTDRLIPQKELAVRTALIRTGAKYASRPPSPGAELAETHFRPLPAADANKLIVIPPPNLHSHLSGSWIRTGSCNLMEAKPLTGRTHQIRVHAAENGFPILGDTLYGGTPAARIYLHAAEIILKHPVSGKEMSFRAPVEAAFLEAPRRSGSATECPSYLASRMALTDEDLSDAYCLIHGAADGWPGWHVERLGKFLLSQSDRTLSAAQREELARLMKILPTCGAYHKILTRQAQRTPLPEACPQVVLGDAAPERFAVRENGMQFELSLSEGYSTGLFLDQRDNRRRLLTGHIAGGFPLSEEASQPTNLPAEGIAKPKPRPVIEILNTFAYACGFSVCAAQAGARTTNLDLSKKYLDWGKRNFALNQIDTAQHDFIYGDIFDWLRRLGRKRRMFDAILLDPPTFSQSRESGVFRAEKDYGSLVTAALPLLRRDGVLFASANAASWRPAKFLTCLDEAIRRAERTILQRHYVPQPPDFPISRSEPAYLKTVWLRVR